MAQYLEAGAPVCRNELAPLNRAADEEGCTFNNGEVTTPKGFKEAYNQFCELGFTAFDCDPAYGGSGLPQVLGFSMEMQTSANVAWSMYPGLSHGAYSAIHAHGEQWMKTCTRRRLLTVPGRAPCVRPNRSGTDLGLLKPRQNRMATVLASLAPRDFHFGRRT